MAASCDSYAALRGYEGWQGISISRNERVVAMILGNPVMIDAYRAGEASIWTMPSSCGLIGRFRLWPEGNFCRNQRW